jgi:hypothetical protein
VASHSWVHLWYRALLFLIVQLMTTRSVTHLKMYHQTRTKIYETRALARGVFAGGPSRLSA